LCEEAEGRKSGLPIAFPVAQAMKLAAMTVVFFVWPAMLRDMRERERVWADQKERLR
jgi:hypothetical protein